ncbi:MAG: hypothetical protein ACI4MN_07255 [Candidatus Coproplasma sp.]
MSNKKAFVYIFAGVIAAGLLCLGVAFIVSACVPNNAIVTIVTLFAKFAGGIMAGVGFIAELISLVILLFSKKPKEKDEGDSENQTAETQNTQEN